MQYIRLRRHARRTLTAGGLVAAVVVCSGVTAAQALTASPRPAPSFNGAVHAIAYRGDIVYVGGSFTGAIVSGRTIARQRLAAFNARTGVLADWRPAANGTVRALAVDGSSVYAAGAFSAISGRKRDSLARIDATSGAVGSFSHTVTGSPTTLAVGSGRLYAGGEMTAVDASKRSNVAAFSLLTGVLDPFWKPFVDDGVYALAVSGSRVYLGGSFHTTNNVSSSLRLTAVSSTTGVLDRTFRPKPPAAVYAIAVDSAGVYAAMGGQGGRAIAYTSNGVLRWARAFDGDAQAITVLSGTTYVGGHFDHACTTMNNGVQGTCIDGSVSRVKLAAIDAKGRLTSWAPQANGVIGVRVLAADPTRSTVAAGGDFTTIGGANRQRYASFG